MNCQLSFVAAAIPLVVFQLLLVFATATSKNLTRKLDLNKSNKFACVEKTYDFKPQKVGLPVDITATLSK